MPDVKATPPGARPPSRDVLENLRRLDRAVHEEVVALLAEAGFPEVRIPHLRVFLYTPEGTGIRMSTLAERLQLTPGAVTQLAAYLEAHGLIERVRDPSDGRATILRPTERTRAGYQASRARVGQLIRGMGELVGQERWETFTSVLGEVLQWQEARVVARRAAVRPKSKGGSDGRRRQHPGARETDRSRTRPSG